MRHDTSPSSVVGKTRLKMNLYFICFMFMLNWVSAIDQDIYETDVNFRIDAGTRTCFFENAKAGKTMEVFYQVLDGQHGDLDISVDVIAPNGTKIVSDYKKSENSIILDIEQDGDYIICLDNTYSLFNSKLVFMYLVMEDSIKNNEAKVSTIGEDGKELEEIVEWIGTDEEGNTYNLDVTIISDSLRRTLHYVVKSRHMLDVYSAVKKRDSYLASEDTLIVDLWSAFQITFMICVGLLQVYVLKKLFDKPFFAQKTFCYK